MLFVCVWYGNETHTHNQHRGVVVRVGVVVVVDEYYSNLILSIGVSKRMV